MFNTIFNTDLNSIFKVYIKYYFYVEYAVVRLSLRDHGYYFTKRVFTVLQKVKSNDVYNNKYNI